MSSKSYLKIATASDLENRRDRFFYRVLEIFPGALSWATLIFFIFLSWQKPVWVAFFIIVFDLYWLIRTIYFSFHLRAGYQKMKEYEKRDWLAKVKEIEEWQYLYHLIVITIYKEPLEIVRASLKSLQETDFPKDKMIVVLATEERGGEKDRATARALKEEFGSVFFKFLVTCHPKDLEGEIAGKGSNETWAAREAKEKIIDPLGIPYKDVIYSTFDADTVVFPKYFSCLSYHYLTLPKPTRTSYQPIPLYINNIWEAPVFSRLFGFSSTFWHSMNQERPEKLITFSSHSMSFKALVDVGFKQTNVVSDDSRIFWQCFFYYNGDYRVQPLYYPVAMDAIVAKTWFKTLKGLYKQQRRWAYGVGEIPYFLFRLFKSWSFLHQKKEGESLPLKKTVSLALELLESHWSWATAPFLIFLLGWLPLVIGGQEFNQTLLSYNLPRFTSYILTLAMVGIIGSVYFSLLLLPPKPPHYGRYKYFLFAFQWFLLPLNIIFFSALPALEAQTRWMFARYMGFWPTEKFRRNFEGGQKQVSPVSENSERPV